MKEKCIEQPTAFPNQETGFSLLVLVLLTISNSYGQQLSWKDQRFELNHVSGAVVNFQGEKVLRLERDLKSLSFDENRLDATCDEPTYARLLNLDFENGVIEVKVLSGLQDPLPFALARGFIGVAFRISEKNDAFEAFYLRPTNGHAANEAQRSRVVQYFSYPEYKFGRLRKESPGVYEAPASIDVNQWITIRIEVKGEKATIFLNNSKAATLTVNKMKGQNTHGSIGLWVDIGTIGYFKDLKVIPCRK